MKVVYSIKINNPVVFTECIKPIALENKYELFSDDMNDFRFCPWLIAYYDDGKMQLNNINEGFYNRIKRLIARELDDSSRLKMQVDI